MNLLFDIILEVLSYWEIERSNHRGPWLYTKSILQPSLFAACLLNKTWNEAATRLLYRDVFLASSRTLTIFWSTLHQREDFRVYVRYIFFTRAYSGEAENWIVLDRRPDLERLYSICPNVHSLTFESRDVRFADAEIGSTVLRDFPGRQVLGFGALTRLEMQTSGTVPDVFSPRLSLPMLSDLIVRGMKLISGRKVNSPWPKMPRLRRLCLIDCDFSPAVMCLPKFENGAKGLRALEIVGGNYSGYGLREAIMRTCRSLELLTFLPSLSHTFPCDFSSLVALRVSRKYMRTFTPNDLPPHLVHLVVVNTHGDKAHTGHALSSQTSYKHVPRRFIDSF
ncbi:hypothetical protein ACEPAI_1669 [Sanghuangporus weigelae]